MQLLGNIQLAVNYRFAAGLKHIMACVLEENTQCGLNTRCIKHTIDYTYGELDKQTVLKNTVFKQTVHQTRVTFNTGCFKMSANIHLTYKPIVF